MTVLESKQLSYIYTIESCGVLFNDISKYGESRL
jgi:hypothetical protein